MPSVTSLQVQQLRSVVLSLMLLSALLRKKKKEKGDYTLFHRAKSISSGMYCQQLWGRNQEPISVVFINCSMSVISSWTTDAKKNLDI